LKPRSPLLVQGARDTALRASLCSGPSHAFPKAALPRVPRVAGGYTQVGAELVQTQVATAATSKHGKIAASDLKRNHVKHDSNTTLAERAKYSDCCRHGCRRGPHPCGHVTLSSRAAVSSADHDSSNGCYPDTRCKWGAIVYTYCGPLLHDLHHLGRVSLTC